MMTTDISSLPRTGTRMTFEEFQALNLPESSGLSLLGGVVYNEWDEWQSADGDMTKRNWRHAEVESRISYLLQKWRQNTGYPCRLFCGEVGCEEPTRGLDVGIDVAVFAADAMQDQTEPFIKGVPLLAVEILSPSDRQGAVDDKVDGYLQAGTAMVWIVNPRDRSVIIKRTGHSTELHTEESHVSGDDVLPGFSEPAAEFFK
ncbi:MAG: Uma2 family endonuclease [Planctomycetaceae bacterium]